MIRLFIKMYGFAILTMVALFYIQGEVNDYFRRQAGVVSVRERFAGTFFLIERDLESAPKAEWNAHLEALRQGFAYPVFVDPMDQVQKRFTKLTPESIAALKQHQVLSYDREGGGFFLFRGMAGSDDVIILELPGPKDVRYVSLTVNWIIQLAAFALILAFWVRPFWRDVMALHRAADAVGEGRFDEPVGLQRRSALAQLGSAFESMKQRIARLLSSHRELTSAVSHELRNPIMRLHYRQTLARDAATLEEKDRNLDFMQGDLEELDRLADELLTYAKLEHAEPKVQLETVAAREWFADVEREAADLVRAQGSGVRLDFQVGVDTLELEPRYMRRALSNLLSNAIRFASTRVLVTASQEAGRTVIRVEDDGVGVAPQDREKIFEPFIRLDASRDRSTGGFGIGLALVRRIAQWHGGQATVGDSPLGGARFDIAW